MNRLSMLALLPLLVVACQRDAPAEPPTATAPKPDAAPLAPGDVKRHSMSALPDELFAHVAGPDAAIKQLKSTLSKRVLIEMKAGGPTRAIEVCRDEAQALTARLAKRTDLEIGRTAARLRNPKNAAPDWLADYVKETADKKAKELQPLAFDLGDRVAVVRPIGTAGPCLKCHGPAEAIDAEVKKTLAEAYPDDAAVGFAAGDLRGLFWAVKKKAP